MNAIRQSILNKWIHSNRLTYERGTLYVTNNQRWKETERLHFKCLEKDKTKHQLISKQLTKQECNRVRSELYMYLHTLYAHCVQTASSKRGGSRICKSWEWH